MPKDHNIPRSHTSGAAYRRKRRELAALEGQEGPPEAPGALGQGDIIGHADEGSAGQLDGIAGATEPGALLTLRAMLRGVLRQHAPAFLHAVLSGDPIEPRYEWQDGKRTMHLAPASVAARQAALEYAARYGLGQRVHTKHTGRVDHRHVVVALPPVEADHGAAPGIAVWSAGAGPQLVGLPAGASGAAAPDERASAGGVGARASGAGDPPRSLP